MSNSCLNQEMLLSIYFKVFVYGNHARKPLKSTIPSGIQKIEKFNEIQVASNNMLIPTYFQVFSLTIMHINPFKWPKIQNCHKMFCGNVSGVDRESNRIIMGFDRQCLAMWDP